MENFKLFRDYSLNIVHKDTKAFHPAFGDATRVVSADNREEALRLGAEKIAEGVALWNEGFKAQGLPTLDDYEVEIVGLDVGTDAQTEEGRMEAARIAAQEVTFERQLFTERHKGEDVRHHDYRYVDGEGMFKTEDAEGSLLHSQKLPPRNMGDPMPHQGRESALVTMLKEVFGEDNVQVITVAGGEVES